MHPDPVRGDDAVRRLQRRRGRVLAARGRRSSASLANLVGSWIAYAVGYFGRIELLERHGRSCTSRRSTSTGRPLVRALRRRDGVLRAACCRSSARSSRCPAGVARMPFWRFTVLTFLGCIPWVFVLAFIGKQAAANWEDWKDALHYVDYAVAALIVAAIVYLVVRSAAPARRGRAGRRCPPEPADGAARVTPRRSRSALLHGPAELLPISSSGHVALVPWLLGWRYARARRRAAQGVRGRAARRHRRGAADRRCATRSREAARGLDRRRVDADGAVVRARRRRSRALLERPIERHLGTPATIAAGLRSARSRWRRPTARRSGATRERRRRASTRCALGLAQACALVPGVSRNGATLAAARCARLHARGRERALAPRRAADDRRRDRR